MGNLNKKFIVKEAEGILEECEFRENLKKKQLIEINNKYKNLKKKNLILKIITALMSIILLTIII